MVRGKMDRADRAKQFMPFDALKGLREALKEKEKIIVPKMDLTDDAKDELDRVLHQINVQDIVSIVYFEKDEYLKVTGMVSRFDPSAKIIKVVNTKINFEDIAKIEIV